MILGLRHWIFLRRLWGGTWALLIFPHSRKTSIKIITWYHYVDLINYIKSENLQEPFFCSNYPVICLLWAISSNQKPIKWSSLIWQFVLGHINYVLMAKSKSGEGRTNCWVMDWMFLKERVAERERDTTNWKTAIKQKVRRRRTKFNCTLGELLKGEFYAPSTAKYVSTLITYLLYVVGGFV